MIRMIFAALVMLVFSAETVFGQTCPAYSYTFTNGTTADANQVMSNFNVVWNCANTLASGGSLANTTLTGTTAVSGNLGIGAAPLSAVRVGITLDHATTDGIRMVDTNASPFDSWIFGMGTGGVNQFAFFNQTQGSIKLTLSGGATTTMALTGNQTISGTLTVSGGLARGITTQTGATYTIAATDTHIIANRAGTITMTLPAAASYTGRELTVRTITANTVVSASSNVVPCAGGSAGTAILAATAGKWAMLVSDGSNWQVQMCN